jgi:phage portal protein BeeE
MGVPGVAISPAEGDAELPDGMGPRDIARLWQSKFTGDRRGEPFVSEIPLKIEKIGLNPEEMIIDKVSRIPEARICAAFQISPIVIGMEIGLSNSTYSNYDHALQATYQSNVLRGQRIIRSAIQRKLLPELGGDPQRQRAWFDNSEISALQDDRSEAGNLAAVLYHGGVAKRWQAKELAGLDFDEQLDDVYITDLGPMGGGGSLGESVNIPDGGTKTSRLDRELGLLRGLEYSARGNGRH